MFSEVCARVGIVIIHGMQGLGDNVYQRAFVKNLPRPVYLETPWPELYADLEGVQFLRPVTKLRTQAKNIARQTQRWVAASGPNRRISYGGDGIVAGMQKCFGVGPGTFDLPPMPSPRQGRYAVVRPATIRREWLAEARNPRPEYIAEAASILMDRGYRVISVADLEPGVEWALDPLPPADERLHGGELTVTELLGLVQHATVVIGGVGWILPAAIAGRVPAWIIFGGWGFFNAPERLVDCRMEVSHIGIALPDRFCRCRFNRHSCDKRISDHAGKFSRWLAGRGHAAVAA